MTDCAGPGYPFRPPCRSPARGPDQGRDAVLSTRTVSIRDRLPAAGTETRMKTSLLA